MMGPITVTVTPTDGTNLLDCTVCGALGVWPQGETSSIVYDHMVDVHDIDPNTIDINHMRP